MASIGNLVVEIKAKNDDLKRGLSASSRDVSSFSNTAASRISNAFKLAGRSVRPFVSAIKSASAAISSMARVASSALRRVASGFSSLAKIITGVTLVSVGLLIREIFQVADGIDVVAKQAKALNIGVETFQELSYAASLAGVENEKLSATLRFMNRTIGETATGVGAAQEAFSALNLDAATLTQLSLDQQFEVIAHQLRMVENASQRSALAAKLFGAEGIFAVNKLIDGLGDARDEFAGLGVGISGEQAAAVEAFNDAKTSLLVIWTGFKQQVVSLVAPAFQTIIENIRETIRQNGGIKDSAQAVADAIIAGTNVIVKYVKAIYEEYKAGFPTLKKFRDIAMSAFESAKSAAEPVLKIITTIADAIDAATSKFLKLNQAVSGYIVNNEKNISTADKLAQRFIDENQARESGLSENVITEIARQSNAVQESRAKFQSDNLDAITSDTKSFISSISDAFSAGNRRSRNRATALAPTEGFSFESIATVFEDAGDTFKEKVESAAERVKESLSDKVLSSKSNASTLSQRILEDRQTLSNLRSQALEERRRRLAPSSTASFFETAARSIIGNTGPRGGVDAGKSIEELFRRQEEVIKAQAAADKQPAQVNVILGGDLAPLVQSVSVNPQFQQAVARTTTELMQNSARATRR